jgi:hypothetical protein
MASAEMIAPLFRLDCQLTAIKPRSERLDNRFLCSSLDYLLPTAIFSWRNQVRNRTPVTTKHEKRLYANPLLQ